MTTLVKLIIGICLAFSAEYSQPETGNQNKPIAYTMSKREGPIKAKAYKFLTNERNVCLSKRNISRVFAKENMNGWSTDVHTQVFIKKRMPYGKKMKHTSEDYQDLLTWISSLNNNQNGNQL